MFSIDCEKCGSELEVDELRTRRSYSKDMNYLINDIGKITEKTIQAYLIYVCTNCGAEYKYTYRDWEKRMRFHIANEVMQVRKAEAFSKIDAMSVDPDNGIEYCGLCTGYDNEGNCFVDVINQCEIRKSNAV